MAKRKLFDEDAITGYLLQVSTVETSASGKTKYFTGLFQHDKNDSRRLVCFLPEKHEQFVRAKELDMPCKILNAKLTPGRDGLEIRFQRESSIEILQAPLSFSKLARPDDSFREEGGPSTQLCEIKTENRRATVKVKIVGFLSNQKETPTKYGTKITREAAVADQTKCMRMTFWGNTSQLVETGKCYIITNVTSRIFNAAITLNTSMTSKISSTENLKNTIEDRSFMQQNKIVVSLNQIKITQNFKCCNMSCNKTIQEVDFKQNFIRCNNCQMKQRVKSMKRTTTAFLNVTLENSVTRKFVIFEEALQKFLQTEERSHLIDNPDRLEDHLLEIEQFTISHQIESDVLSEIVRFPVSHQSQGDSELQEL